jgi:hypothetical protein
VKISKRHSVQAPSPCRRPGTNSRSILFHFDLPWNPSRLEQRNGRIDRKLQPAERVYCRYFIYAQRLEDRVLRRLVEKTEIIRKQLGSASPVIETRISELLAGGIVRQNADRVVAEVDRIEQSDKERRARDDLEPVREADAGLARRRVGVDRVQLRRVVTFGLRLAGARPLHEAETETGPQRFEFHADEVAAIRDEGLGRIIGALRDPTDRLGTGALQSVSFRTAGGHRCRARTPTSVGLAAATSWLLCGC